MDCTKLAAAFFALATTLLAADPFAGTWKLNPSKTKYRTGAPAKDQTIVITEKGEDLDVDIKGTASDGTPVALRYTMPAKGGTGKMIQGPWDGVSTKRPNANTREITYMKGGKSVYHATPTVSSDGKEMRAAIKGTDALGKAVEGTVVFDKQ